MYYVIGLGNPGDKYSNTRHNIGRDVVKGLALDMGAGEFVADKFARALRTTTNTINFLLPETFMNKSGETIHHLVQKESVSPDQIVVVFDDVNIPFGDIKISVGKSHGGHNGVRDVERVLGTRDYIQVRIGVAQKSWWSGEVRRPPASELANFVLHPFSFFEKRQLIEVKEKIQKAITVIVKDGVTIAMNQCN